MNATKNLMAAAFVLGTCLASAVTVPTVSDVTLKQTGTRKMTISYKLNNGPAVITFDIQTNSVNATGEIRWTSIGGEHIQRVSFGSDVFRKVTGDTTHTINWEADLNWPGHIIENGCIRAVVTAWTLDNKPDYMVVDLMNPSVDGERYYPGEEWLPGGLLANAAYRRTKLVMRKIDAKDVKWTMSSFAETGRDKNCEVPHDVTLSNNYYIGVFEFTQQQYAMFFRDQWDNPVWPGCHYTGDGTVESRASLPVENLASTTVMGRKTWDETPSDTSLIGKIRTATGIDFDLPSEAQWEFACRAGHGEGCWGNGKPILGVSPDVNLSACYNTDHPEPVGSHEPNSWGLYDMCGNVGEYVLDFFDYDISSHAQGEIQPNVGNDNRQVRGGNYASNATSCRPSARSTYYNAGWTKFEYGFRLACRAGLK